MLDEKDGVARLPQALDVRGQLLNLRIVHAGGGFVERQQRGLRSQSSRQLQAALLAEIQVSGQLITAVEKARHGQQLFHPASLLPPRLSTAVRRGAQSHPHIVKDAQMREQGNGLEGASDPKPDDLMGLGAGDLVSFESEASCGGWKDTGEDIEQGGFARAVGPDQGEDLARLDLQVDTLQRFDTAEMPRQLLDGQHETLGLVNTLRRHRARSCRTTASSMMPRGRNTIVKMISTP